MMRSSGTKKALQRERRQRNLLRAASEKAAAEKAAAESAVGAYEENNAYTKFFKELNEYIFT